MGDSDLSRFLPCACVLGCFSRVQLLATLWTAARQAPPSLGFSRQEHWSGLSFPSSGNLPDTGIEPTSPTSHMSLALAGRFFTTNATWEALLSCGTSQHLSDPQILSDCKMREWTHCLKPFQNVFHHGIRVILHSGNILPY